MCVIEVSNIWNDELLEKDLFCLENGTSDYRKCLFCSWEYRYQNRTNILCNRKCHSQDRTKVICNRKCHSHNRINIFRTAYFKGLNWTVPQIWTCIPLLTDAFEKWRLKTSFVLTMISINVIFISFLYSYHKTKVFFRYYF